MTPSNHYTEFADSVQVLFDRGAHLTPLSGHYHVNYATREPAAYENAKRPKRSWRKYPVEKQRIEARDNYLRANNWLGLIPSSVGLVCLDLDEGDDSELRALLASEHIDYATIKTRRGWHFIMRAGPSWPKGNWNWQHKSCAGEVRYDNGYILLWNPNQLVDFLNSGILEYPAGKKLAAAIRKKRQPPKQTAATTSEKQSELAFGPYPPGARDEKLFKDLARLVDKRLDNEITISEVKAAWLDAPDPKNQGRFARETIFNEKLDRLRSERIERSEFQFQQKDEEALRQALAKMNIAFMLNQRANRFDWRINGEEPTSYDDSLDSWLIKELAANFTYRRGNGYHPLRYSVNQFNQFMGALTYDSAHRYDPFIRWLERLPAWDKQPRLSGFLCRHFEADHSDLTYWASRYPFIAAIQRAYEPGCKLDEIAVLIGKQGLGKSAFLGSLFPAKQAQEWYSSAFDFTSTTREQVEATMGTVIVEIGEMAGIGRDLQKQKVYLSQTTDHARLAYDRKKSNLPRRFAFVGTADRKEVLPNDPAGNRRFVAVELIKGCHIEKVMDEQRELLWSEALHDFRHGERANLPRKLMQEQLKRNEEYRRADDEFENRVAELDEGRFYSLNELYDKWEIHNPNQRIRNRIATAMTNQGFERERTARHRGWIKQKKLL